MTSPDIVIFGVYQFDPTQEQLRKDNQPLKLRCKTISVLGYLLERAGQLVSKDELFAALWPGTSVGDATLAACIRELRKAFGDDPRQPQFIETVHGRGYRWIGEIKSQRSKVKGQKWEEDREGDVQGSKFKVQSPQLIPNPQSLIPSLVGRETELAQLHAWFAYAQADERQLVFVAGELGIGKTTLVDAFVDQLGQDSQCWTGRGQCIESYGNGAGYLPLVLKRRICRRRGWCWMSCVRVRSSRIIAQRTRGASYDND